MSDTTRENQKVQLYLRDREAVEFVGTVTNIRLDRGIRAAQIPDVSYGRVEFEGKTYRVSQQHTDEWPQDMWSFIDPARFDSDDEVEEDEED